MFSIIFEVHPRPDQWDAYLDNAKMLRPELVQIDGFIDKDEFKKQIDDWIHVFRNTKPAPGTNGPLIPGDPEREAEAIRSKEGIPLLQPVVDDLLDISRKTGIPFEVK